MCMCSLYSAEERRAVARSGDVQLSTTQTVQLKGAKSIARRGRSVRPLQRGLAVQNEKGEHQGRVKVNKRTKRMKMGTKREKMSARMATTTQMKSFMIAN